MSLRSPATERDLVARAYAGGRASTQRLAVARAAERACGAFTVDDLSALTREDDPRVSTATVYRCVAAMAASGHITEVGERDGAALWVRCDTRDHHHHLVCTSCGATTHAPCPVDVHALATAAPDGFIVISHDVRLYGLCADCNGRAFPDED
jgi:Fe2+ or Zn2+ uptake regulation protein